jgi:hypothetical protein
MKYFVSACIILSLFFTNNGVSAQCCAAGNPVSGDGQQKSINKNQLRIYTSFKHSYSDQYYYGNKKEEVSFIDNSRFNYSSLQATYGITKKLNLQAELGYFFDKSQTVYIPEKFVFKGYGIGDLGITAKYQLMSLFKPQSELVANLGIKIPVGKFDQDMDGIILPVSLQPSTGAMKYNAGLYYSYVRPGNKFSLYSFLFAEYSSLILSDFYYYKYGNLYMLSLFGKYKLGSKVFAVIQLREELREKDKRENNEQIESTGSYVTYVAPQFIYNFYNNWTFICQADIPVYKYVNGHQLTNKYAFSCGLQKTLDFNKKDHQEPID